MEESFFLSDIKSSVSKVKYFKEFIKGKNILFYLLHCICDDMLHATHMFLS